MTHSYVKLWNEFENNSRKIEESGKILGKDLWVRAHSKEMPLKWFKREIAPVELNGLNEITISKQLERIKNGNTNLLRYLQHSGTHGKREVNDYEIHRHEKNIWNKERNVTSIEGLNLVHRRRKRTKNNKLEAPLVSSWQNHRIRTLKEKNEETSHH